VITPAFNTFINSPIGLIEIRGTSDSIKSVLFAESSSRDYNTNSYLELCSGQLQEYFAGTRRDFKLKLDPDGTEFQKKVWDLLLTVSYGTTRSYSWQAKELKNPAALRAIAAANGQHKIPIIIPCHRIIGSTGALVGYAGGLWRKRWLLEHEQKFSGLENQLNLHL
jgi:methylated-DNA-[protein]-cysteine S-methyltransferase